MMRKLKRVMLIRKMKNMMNGQDDEEGDVGKEYEEGDDDKEDKEGDVDKEEEEGDIDKEDDVFRRLIRDHGRCSQTTTFSLRYYCGLSYLVRCIHINTYITINIYNISPGLHMHMHYPLRSVYTSYYSPGLHMHIHNPLRSAYTYIIFRQACIYIPVLYLPGKVAI
jgi:hypothetical protein